MEIHTTTLSKTSGPQCITATVTLARPSVEGLKLAKGAQRNPRKLYEIMRLQYGPCFLLIFIAISHAKLLSTQNLVNIFEMIAAVKVPEAFLTALRKCARFMIQSEFPRNVIPSSTTADFSEILVGTGFRRGEQVLPLVWKCLNGYNSAPPGKRALRFYVVDIVITVRTRTILRGVFRLFVAKSPRSQLFLKVVCWGKKELLAASALD
uniref:Uncharacterized protein n=1 Tax=Timema bartmani TaxID=61472 RepID=A0A7R9F9X2_9NEOP|nr:unnamed protein product [Timema bartmani]